MEKIVKSIRFPKVLESRIRAYQKANEISTFTQALFVLVRHALKTEGF